MYKQLPITHERPLEDLFALESQPISLTVRHEGDPLLSALTLTTGSLDFGDSSSSKATASIIFLTISLVSLTGVLTYIYRMACTRVWEPTPSADKYKTKKLYQYEDDKRM